MQKIITAFALITHAAGALALWYGIGYIIQNRPDLFWYYLVFGGMISGMILISIASILVGKDLI